MGMKVINYTLCVCCAGRAATLGSSRQNVRQKRTQFMTDEVQHCLEVVPGRSYTVESVVSTTAKYGDKFKTLVRYWYCLNCSHNTYSSPTCIHDACMAHSRYVHYLFTTRQLPIHDAITPRYTAQGQQACELQVAYSVVVLHPVPKLVRPMILRGADSGLRKNFAMVVELLQRRCVVKTMQPGGERGWVEQAPSGVLEAGGAPGWTLTVGLTGELLAVVRPWARVAVGLPGVGAVVGVDTLCAVLSGSALLMAAVATVGTLALAQCVCLTAPGTTACCSSPYGQCQTLHSIAFFDRNLFISSHCF